MVVFRGNVPAFPDGFYNFRAYPEFLFESFGEYQLVSVSDTAGNFLYGHVCTQKQAGCFVHSVINEKTLGGHIQFFLKGTV